MDLFVTQFIFILYYKSIYLYKVAIYQPQP